MKKMFFLYCLLHISIGYAMHGLVAAVIGTTPITASGGYQYYKTKQLQKKLLDDDQKGELIENDTFRPFVSGVVHGTVPPHNFIDACIYGPALLFCEFEKWEKHEKELFENDRERARAIGFMAGLSLYATVPLALRCMRR